MRTFEATELTKTVTESLELAVTYLGKINTHFGSDKVSAKIAICSDLLERIKAEKLDVSLYPRE